MSIWQTTNCSYVLFFLTDIVNTDNWQTDIYFTPFAGINLWLWSTEARWHFKIAQVGPEARNPEIQSVAVQSIADTKFCEPQCIVEKHGSKYMNFNLPGGQPNDKIPFSPGSMTTAPTRSMCKVRSWVAFNYTCTGNRDGTFSWKRPSDAFQEEVLEDTSNSECVNELSAYGSVVDEVGQGQQALQYGDYDFPSTISQNLELCGEFPSHRYSAGTGVDKIIKFEVWTKNYWGHHIVWGRRITYRMKEGDPVVHTHGTLQGTYRVLNVREGEYITQVEWRQGKFVDAIRLCLNTGACTGWWGGSGGSYRKNKYTNGIITSKWLTVPSCRSRKNVKHLKLVPLFYFVSQKSTLAPERSGLRQLKC